MSEEEKKSVNELKEEINKPVEVQGDKFNTFILYNIESAKTVLNLIAKLQKENEELKEENEYNKLLLELNNNFTIDKKTGNYKWNVIEIQKIKDKIEELNKEIKSCTEIDAIFKIKQQQILQELLGDK